MPPKRIFVFDHSGTLGVFPTGRPVKGRGTDQIILQNDSGVDVHWYVPKGVFDDVNDHHEDVPSGQQSGPQTVNAQTARVVAYRVTLAKRARGLKKKLHQLAKIKSDPIIIIDVD